MSSFNRSIAVLFAVLFTLFAWGCHEGHRCADAELCNGIDDDCDRKVDEDFLNASGMYFTREHCGACNLDCNEVLPTAASTECAIDDEGDEPLCRVAECPPMHHLSGDTACVPDVLRTCLPCESDEDCSGAGVAGSCVDTASGDKRCFVACGEGCPAGTECTSVADAGASACVPTGGDCTCNDANLGLAVPCVLESGSGHVCAGARICGSNGFGACEAALSEVCNEEDDDCDGDADEDFRDENGVYTARLHCGGCGMPCVEPGPNMVATCTSGTCDIECAEGFVDVDRVAGNGCECERYDGEGPPPASRDSDCDGIPDDTTDFIYVTTTGNDSNPGSLARPMRTIQAAIRQGRTERKDVVVARGIYEGPVGIVAGVSIFGGYSPDFSDRDVALHQVLIEQRRDAPGTPALTCRNIRDATRIDGFVIETSDAIGQSQGSTAVYLDRCGPAVLLSQITVIAGRAANGAPGLDASDRLDEWGLPSLDALAGSEGGTGGPGSAVFCQTLAGGAGGTKMCPTSGNVSGGNGGAGACPDIGCVVGQPCGNGGCTDYTRGGVCDIAEVLRDAVPNPPATRGRGPDGGDAGTRTYNAPTNRGACSFCDDNPTLPRSGGDGEDGAPGGDGNAGGGCGGGTAFDASTGLITGRDGAAADPGTDGSGGGGATAGSGYAVVDGTQSGCTDRSGGSGGGGGSGGCGAPGAGGGTGGGVSAGVVVRLVGAASSGPTMSNVRVVTASGGTGGAGGIGASGGPGGGGGLGGVARFWCARNGGRGGDGGAGGAGGGGGGGCGGGSHGVAVVTQGQDVQPYVGEIRAGVMVEAAGIPGRGGVGGFSPGNAGAAGTNGSNMSVAVYPE